MFDKILVYEDAFAPTHPALDRAIALAKGSNVELKVVDVVRIPDQACHDHHRKMRNVVEMEREDRLEMICQPLRDLKITHSVELLRGRPFVEIIREVVHEGFDLLIKSTSLAAPNDLTGVMGPIDMRIVRNCPCPVWLQACGERSTDKVILVAIDPQAIINDLNHVLIKRSVKLAHWMGATLHVVAAWEAVDENVLSAKLRPEKLEQYLTLLKSKATDSLAELLKPAGSDLLAQNTHFRKAVSEEWILQCVDSLRPDLLVMGTVCETGVGGLLIGNTADMVLRRIQASVLAIKPDTIFTT